MLTYAPGSTAGRIFLQSGVPRDATVWMNLCQAGTPDTTMYSGEIAVAGRFFFVWFLHLAADSVEYRRL
jgi:hypothetical protein